MAVNLEERIRRFFAGEAKRITDTEWGKVGLLKTFMLGRGKRTVEQYGTVITVKDGDVVLGRYRMVVSVRLWKF